MLNDFQRKREESVKVKLVLALGVGALVFAGIAQGAGLFTASAPNKRLARERTLIRKAQRSRHRGRSGGATISARRGPRGPRGPRGFQGPPGPPGSFSSLIQVSGAEAFLCSRGLECSIESAHVECPTGTAVVSGGWAGAFLGFVFFSFAEHNGWSVGVVNEGTEATSFHAIAVCAT